MKNEKRKEKDDPEGAEKSRLLTEDRIDHIVRGLGYVTVFQDVQKSGKKRRILRDYHR